MSNEREGDQPAGEPGAWVRHLEHDAEPFKAAHAVVDAESPDIVHGLLRLTWDTRAHVLLRRLPAVASGAVSTLEQRIGALRGAALWLRPLVADGVSIDVLGGRIMAAMEEAHRRVDPEFPALVPIRRAWHAQAAQLVDAAIRRGEPPGLDEMERILREAARMLLNSN